MNKLAKFIKLHQDGIREFINCTIYKFIENDATIVFGSDLNESINEVFQEYPDFIIYKNPDFMDSIGWWVGSSVHLQHLLQELKRQMTDPGTNHQRIRYEIDVLEKAWGVLDHASIGYVLAAMYATTKQEK